MSTAVVSVVQPQSITTKTRSLAAALHRGKGCVASEPRAAPAHRHVRRGVGGARAHRVHTQPRGRRLPVKACVPLAPPAGLGRPRRLSCIHATYVGT